MLAAFAPNTNALIITKGSVDKKELLLVDLYSKTLGFKSESLNSVINLKNQRLTNIINEMDYVTWNAVPTPRGVYAHEMGHALHNQYRVEIDNIISKGWEQGWQ
ncbi:MULTISPECIES: hypothetical protein [unclassified Gilliamella]|uniref:hypothetical protein n=1 Tax=unclassified Gilliamella TaxID=2685620 RepID=UPI00226A352D|nr:MULTISPECIES: hypothetical protein [unclassified Gilliamella]MCX8602662.1 hypothetical protein [Gilliamella sp. B3722]MCX8607145.1 hypothetical protein [Gilliamella sp. B3771]MCX8611896.1 hypothetical protein [Gilliamella sp. B3891]MCX8614343.1 hypothetical protein [Gilliamella sp. B3773]MCX8615926.1 hypothetical protein [Gilliamella sp. B3770]